MKKIYPPIQYKSEIEKVNRERIKHSFKPFQFKKRLRSALLPAIHLIPQENDEYSDFKTVFHLSLTFIWTMLNVELTFEEFFLINVNRRVWSTVSCDIAWMWSIKMYIIHTNTYNANELSCLMVLRLLLYSTIAFEIQFNSGIVYTKILKLQPFWSFSIDNTLIKDGGVEKNSFQVNSIHDKTSFHSHQFWIIFMLLSSSIIYLSVLQNGLIRSLISFKIMKNCIRKQP